MATLITLAGAVSIPQLPISQFPPIVPPTVRVSATYAGASAEVVERTLTIPIEEQVNGTDGMLYMSSTSANDGQLSLTVTFELGQDPDIAAVNVQNRVAVAEPRLPEEVRIGRDPLIRALPRRTVSGWRPDLTQPPPPATVPKNPGSYAEAGYELGARSRFFGVPPLEATHSDAQPPQRRRGCCSVPRYAAICRVLGVSPRCD